MRKKARILIVDDEPFNIDYLEQELEDLGYATVAAADGVEALTMVQEASPDLILLDVMMPRMDGFEVLSKLKAEDDWRDIPVVIISAMSELASIVKGIEMGAEDYLPKPFEPVLLQARISAGLEKKRLRDIERKHLSDLEQELQIGREIQAGFLPADLPQPDGWELAAHFAVAREVAGDFYDVFEISPGVLALMVGDVCDKGVGSALYMALYRSLLRANLTTHYTLSTAGSLEERLLRAVRETNNYICRTHESPRFVTLFLGLLEVDGSALLYINAGHDPPFLIQDELISAELMPTGPAIGFFEDAEYKAARLALDPGELVFIYTDGVTDVENAAGEMFQTDRLRELLSSHGSGPETLVKQVAVAIDRFVGDTPQYDDVTILALQKKQKST